MNERSDTMNNDEIVGADTPRDTTYPLPCCVFVVDVIVYGREYIKIRDGSWDWELDEHLS
jgi:hypothetical protein